MWIILAVVAAIAQSGRNILTKTTVDNTSQLFTAWITVAVVLVFASVVVLFAGFEINETQEFWQIVAVRLVFDTLALLAFIKALQLKSISYVIPLLAFVPVASTVSAFFINDQTPSLAGAFGILVIVLSGLVLFINEVKIASKSDLDRKQLLVATGLLLVTITGWAIVDPLHKEAIDRSTPYTYFFASNVGFMVIFSLLMVLFDRKSLKEFAAKKYSPAIFLLGILLGFEFLSQLLALEDGLTSFVVSIKSTNIAISSLLAWQFLGERLSYIKVVGIVGALLGIMILVFS